MTTAKQLREYLATLPDDTEVKVVETYLVGYDVITRYVDLGIDRNTDICGTALRIGEV
jgi:hypothetical protein